MVNSAREEASAVQKAQEKPGAKRRKVANPIETANKTSNEEFLKDYIRPSDGWPEWAHPKTGARYTMSLAQPADLSDEELDGCFKLIDETSGGDYRNSSVGWHPAVKKKEMRSPDLRYVLVKDGEGAVKGFTSMMPTFENSEPVVYCYEVHLEPHLQGTGLGKQLMGYLAAAAEHIPSVAKVMLTCFASNTRARAFYERLGFAVDAYSPREKRLRGGRVVVPDYVILSRSTASGA